MPALQTDALREDQEKAVTYFIWNKKTEEMMQYSVDEVNKAMEELVTTKKILKGLYEAVERYIRAARVQLEYDLVYDYSLLSPTVGSQSERFLIDKLNSASGFLEKRAESDAEEARIKNVVRKVMDEVAAERVEALVNYNLRSEAKTAEILSELETRTPQSTGMRSRIGGKK